MNKIHLIEVKSTNSWVLEQLAQGVPMEDMTVVWTKRQTAGRGQVGNSWESEADKNISFSVLLCPAFVAPRDQFVISEITALAVSETIPGSTIKWPNDIYIDDDKVCGILIENQLQGMTLAYSVLGVGINVNQERWIGNAPNPTSIKLKSGVEHSPEEVLDQVVEKILRYYQQLQLDPMGTQLRVHSKFCERLYRREGLHPYVDVQTGEAFLAKIKAIEPTGVMHLETDHGQDRAYYFKEVKFVLPCGVTKE